jgi:hypothetical protein
VHQTANTKNPKKTNKKRKDKNKQKEERQTASSAQRSHESIGYISSPFFYAGLETL